MIPLWKDFPGYSTAAISFLVSLYSNAEKLFPIRCFSDESKSDATIQHSSLAETQPQTTCLLMAADTHRCNSLPTLSCEPKPSNSDWLN